MAIAAKSEVEAIVAAEGSEAPIIPEATPTAESRALPGADRIEARLLRFTEEAATSAATVEVAPPPQDPLADLRTMMRVASLDWRALRRSGPSTHAEDTTAAFSGAAVIMAAIATDIDGSPDSLAAARDMVKEAERASNIAIARRIVQTFDILYRLMEPIFAKFDEAIVSNIPFEDKTEALIHICNEIITAGETFLAGLTPEDLAIDAVRKEVERRKEMSKALIALFKIDKDERTGLILQELQAIKAAVDQMGNVETFEAALERYLNSPNAQIGREDAERLLPVLAAMSAPGACVN